ncbi:MAG: hypothetical protein OZ913_00455 [Ignavibacteriaceae bacterium]|jgi:hypothetical protein|nr:MAG: hypothetical protein EDM69_04570 [Chlorobiota bacterium]KXK04899.1 MAG: hypothetical protein UZ04_CHB001000787 [Chlorobi bacterium OLB4]MBV6397716.1 hypothetical protein [Ignavibacteria bacterium]MCE7952848.1 hypothetical protein [Chlorobi bacterium CHB7]MDL1886985.1 hypothetical protein [Ignavibacteria bacterium CHB1]MEB2328757.1 hypothetical protein [Ignavibacteriaceae bacterium]OQY79083.1 MAG: hypothetical protein B6D43_00355 [Ignavibacteriales bacterium UTCHB1]RIK49607.1 MAG: hyp
MFGFKLGFIALSVLLYLISLLLPVFVGISETVSYSGFSCLFMGWFSFSMGIIYTLPYLTNFVYFLSIPFGLFKLTTYIAIPLMVIVLITAFPAFTITQMITDETGRMVTVTAGSGMYVWYLSYVIFLFSLFIPNYRRKVKFENPEEDYTRDIESIY